MYTLYNYFSKKNNFTIKYIFFFFMRGTLLGGAGPLPKKTVQSNRSAPYTGRTQKARFCLAELTGEDFA
jgi:hypothetical protein